jgi:hypothetical protein
MRLYTHPDGKHYPYPYRTKKQRKTDTVLLIIAVILFELLVFIGTVHPKM